MEPPNCGNESLDKKLPSGGHCRIRMPHEPACVCFRCAMLPLRRCSCFCYHLYEPQTLWSQVPVPTRPHEPRTSNKLPRIITSMLDADMPFFTEGSSNDYALNWRSSGCEADKLVPNRNQTALSRKGCRLQTDWLLNWLTYGPAWPAMQANNWCCFAFNCGSASVCQG